MVWRGRAARLVGKAAVLYRRRGRWRSRANGSTKSGRSCDHGKPRSGGQNRSRLVRHNLLHGENLATHGSRCSL